MTFFIRIESEVCILDMRECRDMEKENRIESIFVQIVHVAFERRKIGVRAIFAACAHLVRYMPEKFLQISQHLHRQKGTKKSPRTLGSEGFRLSWDFVGRPKIRCFLISSITEIIAC